MEPVTIIGVLYHLHVDKENIIIIVLATPSKRQDLVLAQGIGEKKQDKML